MNKTKARIELSNGTSIVIEGSPTDVANAVNQLGLASSSPKIRQDATLSNKTKAVNKRITTSPTDLILSLADGGFFKTPKDLASIKEGLAEIGHIYPIQSLSSIVFKMIRRRYLRRIKEDGRWVYMR